MDKLKPDFVPVRSMLGLVLFSALLAGCNPFASPLPGEAAETQLAQAEASALAPARVTSRPAPGTTGVFTYHNDLSRTGLNPSETILTPANVNSKSFGKLFANPVDGYIYAQPLYVAGVAVPGGSRRNIVYVATENDSVYAFDADEGGPAVWHSSLLEGGKPVPSTDFQCDQILPEVGITSTPVIDPATRTLYVVAMVKHDSPDGPSYSHRLHALDIATGAEKFGGPLSISGSVPGTGEGQIKGTVAFDPFPHLNRPALALANGVIYVAFGSHCDMNWFHGWIFAYNAGTANKTVLPAAGAPASFGLRAIYNTTPNGYWGSIWQAGAAPAIDAKGNIYVTTGNGTFHGVDYADSFLRLTLRGNSLRAVDSFTPFDQKILEDQDLDVGASGPILLPDQPGSHPHLIVGTGKSGTIYVVDRDRMGRFLANGNDRQIVQVIRGAIAGNYGTPAYWNGRIYFGSLNDSLKAFALSGGRLSNTAVSQSATVFGYPGTSPSVSADETRNAIVWALQNDEHYKSGPAVLHAYDATDLSHELYKSNAAGNRDVAGPAVKFTSPTIANGKVYVGTKDSVDVYGLL